MRWTCGVCLTPIGHSTDLIQSTKPTNQDDVPVWEVPLSIRREAQGEPPASRIQFLSLEALFPGADGRRLAEAFDSDERFRYMVYRFVGGQIGPRGIG